MNKFKLHISALVLTFVIIFQTSYSQLNIPIDKKEFKTAEKSGYKEALNAIDNGDENFENNSLTSSGGYQMALPEYLAANTYNSNNAALNYKIGVCYIFSTEKKKAITFLEKAYKLDPNISIDIKYVMGMVQFQRKLVIVYVMMVIMVKNVVLNVQMVNN